MVRVELLIDPLAQLERQEWSRPGKHLEGTCEARSHKMNRDKTGTRSLSSASVEGGKEMFEEGC